MNIDSSFPVLPLFDGYLGGLVEEYAETANIQTPNDFINGDPIDLATIMGLVAKISTLMDSMKKSTDPNDQLAVNSPSFKAMEELFNQQFNGNPSLFAAMKDNNQEELAVDILADRANGLPILRSIQIFLANFPNNNQ